MVGHASERHVQSSRRAQARYQELVIEILATFTTYDITQILREENFDTDMLSKLIQPASQYISQLAMVEVIKMASIDTIQVNIIEDQDDYWITNLTIFSTIWEAPKEEKRARKVQLRASRFEITNQY